MSVRHDSVIKAIRGALASDAALTARLTNGSVAAHRHADVPKAPLWVRLLVRELRTPGLADSPTGCVPLPVQVQAEAFGHPDPDLCLSAVLEAAHSVLEGLEVTTDYGDSFLPAVRRRRPAPALYDDKTGSFVSASVYEVVAR